MTWSDERIAPSTSRCAVALIAPDCAVIVTTPADSPVAKPAPLTIATLVSDEDQLTSVSMFSLEPSVKVPAAVYCRPEAGAIPAVVGVRLIDARVAELTVTSVVPVTFVVPKVKVARMFAVPAVTPLTKPGTVEPFPTVAAAVLSELQVTVAVMSCWVESLNTPVADKRRAPPVGMVTFVGEINTDVIVASVTVNVVEPTTLPRVAVTVVWPGARAEAMAALTVATEGFEDVQFERNVTSRVLPSLNVPMATNCLRVPGAMLESAG